MGKYYFLSSILPAMPASLGEKPALSFVEISRIIQRNIEPEDAPLLGALLMMIDVANFEALHQGRDIFIEGGTLSRPEIEHKQNLPLFMRNFLDEKETGLRRAYLFDALWERCYAYAYSLGQERDCRFLTDYIAWDISLRNGLVALRCKDGERDATDHTLLSHIGSQDLSGLMSHLRGQENLFTAERLVDEERLKQIYHCEGSDPFAVDVVLAALERARIFDRWEKMSLPFRVEDAL
jgi:hypothetical protein